MRMDVLTSDDLETRRRTPPEEKLAQAFEMADAGIRLKRAALRHPAPNATETDVDAALPARPQVGVHAHVRALALSHARMHPCPLQQLLQLGCASAAPETATATR